MAAAARSGAKATTDAKAEDVQTSADTGKGSPKGGAGKGSAVPKDGLGKVAYEAYSESVGGKSFNGDDLPSWEERYDTHPEIAAAWEAAAQATLGATFGKKEA